MPLPQSFDQNEWFVIISLTISLVVAILLPRRFSLSLVTLVILFSAAVARLSDHLLAGPTFDFYDLMDTGKYDLFDLFTYFLYMPFAYLFVYFYDKWQIRGYYILLYIIVCSAGGAAYELITSYFNVFNYHSWKNYYSFTVYLAVQPMTLLFFELIKRTQKNQAVAN